MPLNYVFGRRGVGCFKCVRTKDADDDRTEQKSVSAMSHALEKRPRSRCLPLDAKLLSFRPFMLIAYLRTS